MAFGLAPRKRGELKKLAKIDLAGFFFYGLKQMKIDTTYLVYQPFTVDVP